MRKFGPVAIALGGLLSSASYAQTRASAPPTTSAEADAASSRTTEIIVTAQRRAEKLQDIPIAVTAVTAETAQNLGLSKAVDIAAITPGANFTVSAGFFSPNIRGLGVAFTAAGLESPVAIYEDGAYLTNSLAANEILDNFDISSIQVLRGPQGTLYGRNASGGVIIINSADPTFKLGGRVRGEVGNLDHQQLSGMINLPLAQDLALRITGNYKHNGGYIRNAITGENNGWEKNHNVRAKLRWNPGAANIVLGGEYYNLRNTLTRTSALSRYDDTCLGCVLAPGLIPASVGFYEQIGRSLVPPLHTKYYGGTLKMDFDFDNFTLSSLTTYRDQKSANNGGDTDGTPLNLFEFVGFKVGGKTLSQDLQVSSNLDGKFNYIFGLNYLRDRRYFRAAFLGAFAGGAMDPNTSPGFLNEGSTDSYAAFLEGYYKLTDELKVTVGGRYTYDERGMHAEAFGFSADGRTTQRAFTPRFVLAWDNGPTNLYYSFTRGFKAGGFPDGQTTGPLTTVRPEKISSHEIGIKQSMLDKRLTLNAAAFYFKNRDQQVQTIRDVTQGAARTSNAALENYGVEVEVRAVPTEGLNVGITGAWQHPRYKPFDGVIGLICYDAARGLAAPTLYSCNPLVDVSATNLTGTAPPQAPQWAGSFSANYEFAIASWTASLSGLATYRSSINFQPGAGGELKHDRDGSLFLANASGYVSPPGQNLRIGFYVNNLFDKKYVTRRQTLTPFGTSYNAGLPRTYGLRVEYMF
ncbi:TonB-dependent receptor [Sphingobium mellinum]|uniref:TonB-dependent receptor n=1 Tax=Sphingobium mellinum TaxID=1387166 RepID=UPI0030EE4F02